MQSTEGPRDAPLNRTTTSKGNRYAPDHGRRVSKEEYWARWYESPYPDIDVSYEWNNGILEAKPPANAPQIRQYGWFSLLMDCYVQSHPIAKLICLETGVSMTVLDAGEPSGKWEVVYKPDLGVVLNDNPAPWGAPELRAFEGVCDMIVEEVSDATMAEVRRDTEEKRRGYALAGVKEYFILDPADRHMQFYRLTADRRYQQIRPDAAGVIRSQVLPGFQFRRSDLLDLPKLVELVLDDIYAGYVMPRVRDAVNRAREVERAAASTAARRQAEQRAEEATAARRQTEQRAEEAVQRAAASTAARRQAEQRADEAEQRAEEVEEQLQALKAEIARLRQDRS